MKRSYLDNILCKVVDESMASNTGEGENIKQVRINFANAQELKTLPSVSEAIAENIIYFRAVQGNITKENLLTIKFVKESKQLLDLIDFEPKFCKYGSKW